MQYAPTAEETSAHITASLLAARFVIEHGADEAVTVSAADIYRLAYKVAKDHEVDIDWACSVVRGHIHRAAQVEGGQA
jgi:hypothetical protein